MSDIRRIGDSGVHTVEGNMAGARAARLTKEREQQAKEYEAMKNRIKERNAGGVGHIEDKFSTGNESLEQEFRERTLGLVSAEDYKKARMHVDEAKAENMRKQVEQDRQLQDQKKRDRAEKRKKMTSALSFGGDEEEDGDADAEQPNVRSEEQQVQEQEAQEAQLKKKITKNPLVDTAFLPDRARDQAIEEEKERLRQEWLQQQELVKNEMLQVVYSYWDGAGHRKVIQIRKGTTVGRFLELVKAQIMSEFHEVRNVSPDNLVYVKEDLIIPHHYSFYDLIVTKARGKSGPLFHFDVHDDIRLVNDARVEKDESHPGKVVERRWYERNKHIFPASRWEVYDPTVERDRYTIHGDTVN